MKFLRDFRDCKEVVTRLERVENEVEGLRREMQQTLLEGEYLLDKARTMLNRANAQKRRTEQAQENPNGRLSEAEINEQIKRGLYRG